MNPEEFKRCKVRFDVLFFMYSHKHSSLKFNSLFVSNLYAILNSPSISEINVFIEAI